MRKSSTLCVAVNEDGVATVSLDRAEVRNALNPTLIGELTKTIEELSSDAGVRIIVLRGEGPVFCAGADLNWLRDVSGQSKEEVSIDSQRLQRLFTVLNQSPKLTIARIHGAAMAGGVGLVACCDVAIAESGARFSISEVRLGLVPGLISAFLLGKIGPGHLRYLSRSGAVIGAEHAYNIGLVHVVAKSMEELDRRVKEHVEMGLQASPDAIATCQGLLADIGADPSVGLADKALAWNVSCRTSPEALEGIGAFLARRPPPWAAIAARQKSP